MELAVTSPHSIRKTPSNHNNTPSLRKYFYFLH
jgi:hypothetical protein